MPRISVLRPLVCRMLAAVVVPLLFAGYATADGKNANRDHSPEAVVGRVWQWETLVTPVETIEVPIPERYEFELMAEGKARVRFDCNRGGGTYRIDEGKLGFGPLMSTRMGCPPGSLGERFGRDLGLVTTFFLQDGKLYLELPADGGTLRFRRAQAPAVGRK